MRRFILVTGLMVAGLAATQPLPLPTPTRAPIPPPPAAVLTDIAVAYAADEGMQRLRVEAWEEAGPAMGNLVGARVDYFTVEPATIELLSGTSFELNELAIFTHGLHGGLVGGAPLKLTLEAPEGLVDIALALQDQRLLATQRGIGRLWIESLLPRGTGTGERYRLPVVIIVR
jgi:hypothetical protein